MTFTCHLCGDDVLPWESHSHTLRKHSTVIMVPGDEPGTVEVWSRDPSWFDIPNSWMAL
jgi:hypothetical protein